MVVYCPKCIFSILLAYCYITLVCLQAFVKTVGANVNAMEEQVTQAEGELGTLPGAFKKILRTMSVPGFLNVRAPLSAYASVVLHVLGQYLIIVCSYNNNHEITSELWC